MCFETNLKYFPGLYILKCSALTWIRHWRIQSLNNLSDERTEYLIYDRLSFMRFLGGVLSDSVADTKTVCLFRERLTRAGGGFEKPLTECSCA